MAAEREPIAIIGSACRFPGGASSPSKLWDLLRNPRDVLVEFPEDRLVLDNFYNKNADFHGSTNVKNKSYLLSEDIDVFDAAFFHISASEAEGMDPVQRILLETVYEAMEAAGSVAQLRGSQTSVFVGLMTADWADLQMRDTETLSTYAATGTARSIVSNRLAYFFDFKGVSMTIDTACSSSLVALHQAVQSLRSGESTAAIVAGANLILDPSIYISESKLHMLSSESRSRMWDSSADGYARGEGCSALLLKPLSRALADGDHIESVIRQTGVNSDGRTPGITMPSAEAQANLIRSTYRAAGLDSVTDRCQFFECHGTGTAVGDPIEAQAIAEVFFPKNIQSNDKDKMRVGSIKTLIGHLEGCSGLAGVMKASLAIQNRTFPANLLFETINPAIKPYTHQLELVQSSMPWPTTSGTCRRASINSFGFGGTNAHAILESYDPETSEPRTSNTTDFRGPLVFSANSSSSLVEMVRKYSEYIKLNPAVNLDDLAWTLQNKRELFPFKRSFTGFNRDSLTQRMDDFVESNAADDCSPQPLYPDDPPAILGIFTGQGAQWATMGASLIRQSRLFRESIERSEKALAVLPDGPSWSLKAELLAPEDASRLKEAEIAQPLCTAVQIAIFDLAAASGIRFTTVVGHSSGEIAAAYAANIISAADAMAISYYRGYHARLGQGLCGQKGGMMAVSMPYEVAVEFCAQPDWSGRIILAASNSPSSVTLSGDVDAIDEAKTHFDGKGLFSRKLHVDTAYHSHHMLPCADSYLESLKACNIVINEPRADCTWCSSVFGDTVIQEEHLQTLKGQYWVDNMLKPVLFSEAVENSIWNGGPFELVMEIGPHPALQGPTIQVLNSVLCSSPPYGSFLRRGEDAVDTFSIALGQVWYTLGPSFVDFEGYHRASGASTHRMIKGTPTYAWDHGKRYWREGRISRNYRLRKTIPHELLGRRVPDDTEYEMRWRNILRLNEVPWLRGHKFQGQVLYPAAAHIVQALEASKYLTAERSVKLIEIKDVCIHHSIVLEESSTGVETTFTLKILDNKGHTDVIQAEFCNYMFADETKATCRKTTTGRLVLLLKDSHDGGLPAIAAPVSRMSQLEPDSFYAYTKSLGLDYRDVFRGLSHITKGQDCARTTAAWAGAHGCTKYMVHPVLLDLAFQSNLAPLVSSTTGPMGTLYLPTTLDSIVIDPSRLPEFSVLGGTATIDSFVTHLSSSSMTGDIHVYDPTGTSTGIQIEGLGWKTLSEATATNDRLLFSRTAWDVDVCDGVVECDQSSEGSDDHELIFAMDRTALFYFQDLLRQVAPNEVKTFSWHHQRLLEAIEAKLCDIRSGDHSVIQQEWLSDSKEIIDRLHARFPSSIELELMTAISLDLASVVRGETQILEVMLQNNMLDRFYTDGAYAQRLNAYIARVMQQLSHKYPRAKILEIGAGTGGTTRSILNTIGSAGFSSYTYTDISSGFFQKAAEKFSNHRHKMTFKVLNVEDDVTVQNFNKSDYEVIVAANVLHATRKLADTMQHVRSLIKPGGYLVLMEITGNSLAATYTMGALPGWWLGQDDGRRLNPGIPVSEWDTLLRSTGFSGVDKVVYDCPDVAKHTFSVIVSQAIDDQVNLLREPMSAQISSLQERLIIIGGVSEEVSKLSRDIQKLLQQWQHITAVNTLDALDLNTIDQGTFVISLTELDTALFSTTMTDDRLQRLRQLFSQASKVLWLTSGGMSHAPLSNMVVGLGRSLPSELPRLTLQFLDVDSVTEISPALVAKTFLRLVICGRSDPAKRHVFYATEPELKLRADKTLVPRIVLDSAMNDRFNSTRRTITHQVHKDSTPVEVVANASKGQLLLQEATPLATSNRTIVDVQYSTTIAKGCCLSIGTARGSPKLVLAASDINASRICAVDEKHFVASDDIIASPSVLLHEMASHIVARKITEIVPNGLTALVYEPTVHLAAAIEIQSRKLNRKVVFSSSKAKTPNGWISIHMHATGRALRHMVPRSVGCLIVVDQSPPNKLLSSLPKGSVVHRLSEYSITVDRVLLELVYPDAMQSSLHQHLPDTMDVQSLVGMAYKSTSYPSITDWNRSEMTAAVRPLEPCRSMRPNRSYLLVGMTGDLGRSLCKWMITNGARYIVLASRRPEIGHDWLEEMSGLGAIIEVFEMDVSDRTSVHNVYNKIKSRLPPVGGVCNAAMALEDKLFVDMTAESLNKVLAPKVQGSQILDEIFGDELDFFVLFSSLASVFGNAGQSNYHAANLFMQGLCSQRRARGLPASVMHIGFVTDIGYVARSGRQFKNHLSRLSLQLMSESDLQYLFAEAIVNSRPDSKGSWDIVAGIKPFVDSTEPGQAHPPFYANPRFAHFIHDNNGDLTLTENRKQAVTGQEAVKLRLGESKSEKEAISVVQKAFSKQLESMLQIGPNTVYSQRSLMSLGLDSLIAIEIRHWFHQVLDLDISVLSILKYSTVADICTDIARSWLSLRAVSH
ncbi:putative polyketide synthase [Colletotrichum asianum]